jgi:hypothetical protein
MANPKIRAAESDKESSPEVWIAAETVEKLFSIINGWFWGVS